MCTGKVACVHFIILLSKAGFQRHVLLIYRIWHVFSLLYYFVLVSKWHWKGSISHLGTLIFYINIMNSISLLIITNKERETCSCWIQAHRIMVKKEGGKMVSVRTRGNSKKSKEHYEMTATTSKCFSFY
jgi:hypothetical protein